MEYVKKEYEPTKFVATSHDYSAYSYVKDAEGMNIFIKGLKDKKIIGVKCKSCSRVYVPPIPFCGKCFEELDLTADLVELKDEGKIVYYSIGYADIRGNPYEEPNIAVAIQFSGSDSFWMTRLQAKPEEVEVGVPVRIVWKEQRTAALSDIERWEIIRK